MTKEIRNVIVIVIPMKGKIGDHKMYLLQEKKVIPDPVKKIRVVTTVGLAPKDCKSEDEEDEIPSLKMKEQ